MYYEIYVFIRPYLLFLSKDSIKKVKIEKIDNRNKIIKIKYNDIFFNENIKRCKLEEVTIVVQSFDNDNNFIKQIDVYSDYININETEIECIFNHKISNKIGTSINLSWIDAVNLYLKEKLSYLRELRINSILS